MRSGYSRRAAIYSFESKGKRGREERDEGVEVSFRRERRVKEPRKEGEKVRRRRSSSDFGGRLPSSPSFLPSSSKAGSEQARETSRAKVFTTRPMRRSVKRKGEEEEEGGPTYLSPPSDRLLVESLLLRIPDVGVHNLCERKMVSLSSFENTFVVGSFLRDSSSNGVLDFEDGGAGGGEVGINRESREIKERERREVSFRGGRSERRRREEGERERICWCRDKEKWRGRRKRRESYGPDVVDGERSALRPSPGGSPVRAAERRS